MKRLLWFILLLTAGIVALRLAVGDDPMVSHQDTTDPPPPAVRSGAGIPMGQGQINASWQTSGPFHYTWTRTIPGPDGVRRNEPIYQIDAEDSRPIGDGLQQLDRLTIKLFRHGLAAGIVQADQAFVAIGRDANGKLSLQEDKEIDLRGLRMEGVAGSSFDGLRVIIGRARLQFGATSVDLQTQDLAEPVQVDFTGNPTAVLRGKGLRAKLPKDRNAPGMVASLEILSDPVLEANGMVANASGRLLYREATANAAITVTLEENVQLSLPLSQQLSLPGSSTKFTQPVNRNTKEVVTVLADRLTLFGRRVPDAERNNGQEALDLHLIRVTGSPTRVGMQGMDAQAPSFDVVLDRRREPVAIIAWGGEAQINATAPDGASYSAATPELLEVRRHGSQAADMLSGMGFPQWTLQQLQQQNAIHLQGRAQITAEQRNIKTTRGIRILNGDPDGKAAIMDGWGEVTLAIPLQDEANTVIQAEGNNGVRLVTHPDHEEIRLGPAAPADFKNHGHLCWLHRFSIRSETAWLHGSGACTLRRQGTSTELSLLSRQSDITATGSDLQAELQQINSLWILLEGKVIRDLQMTGTPGKASFQSGLEQVVAFTPILYRTGPAAWQAVAVQHMPIPLRLQRSGMFDGCPEQSRLPSITSRQLLTDRGTGNLMTTAPRIDMHLGAAQSLLVDASAIDSQLVEATGSTLSQSASDPTTVRMLAQRVRLLPHLVPPSLVQYHAATAIPDRLIGNLHPCLSWVIAEQVHQFEIKDLNQGILTGKGHRLLLSPIDGSLLLLGDSQTAEPTTITRLHQGRLMTATGAYLRAWRDTDLRVRAGSQFPGGTTTSIPYVVLRQPEAASALDHLGVRCQGDVDLLPAEVLFHGPVEAWSLLENGEHDPAGLALRAQRLHIQRHPTTTLIQRATATDVNMTWRRFQAQSREVELDLRWNQLLARDPVCATVTMPGGQRFAAEYVSINYETMAVEATYGEVERQPIRRNQ